MYRHKQTKNHRDVTVRITETQMQTRYTIIERQTETEPGVEVTDTVCAAVM